MWFQPTDVYSSIITEETPDDEWGGLSRLQDLQDEEEEDSYVNSFLRGDPNELVAEEDLPFTRLKLIDDEAEDELSAVQTGASLYIRSSKLTADITEPFIEPAWVVDISDPKHTAPLLKYGRILTYSFISNLEHIDG